MDGLDDKQNESFSLNSSSMHENELASPLFKHKEDEESQE